MEHIQAKKELAAVLADEDCLLDGILSEQAVVHRCVKQRSWAELESSLAKLDVMSGRFSELEKERERLSAGFDVMRDSDFSRAVGSVRSKLLKSKIENSVLNEYISTTKTFLQQVFDEVLPQRRNVLYGKSGKLIKNEAHSVIVNQVI